MKINVVWGPPASGKTTYAAENSGENDLIYDYDRLMQNLSGRAIYDHNGNLQPYLLDFRQQIIDKLPDDSLDAAWLIITSPSDAVRDELNEMDAKFILMDTDEQTCIDRINADPDRANKDEQIQAVRDWFEKYAEEEDKGSMNKILKLSYENPKTHIKSTGRMEIKNQTAGSADLYFYGDICSSSWDVWQEEDMCPQDVADFLRGLSGAKSIGIYINSGGGDSFAGIAIYNILKRNPAQKYVSVDGLAASAASLIALIGALPGNTLKMHSGSQIMIHNAWGIVMGNCNDLRHFADVLEGVNQSYADVYASVAAEGVTVEQLRAMMDAETWMTGEQAQSVFRNIQLDDVQAAASLDYGLLDRYHNVPESLTINPAGAPMLYDKSGKPVAYLIADGAPGVVAEAKLPIVHDGVVPPNISTDKAPEDQTWETLTLQDFTAKQWGDLTDQEKRDIAGHFAWAAGMPPDTFGDLKFGHHDPKTHKVVLAGLSAVASRLNQADIPDADISKVKDHIAAHYHDFGRKAPWEQDDDSEDQDIVAVAKAKLALELSL